MDENLYFGTDNNRVTTASNAAGMNKSLFSPSNMQRSRMNGSEVASRQNKELITSYDGNSSKGNYMNKLITS